jgi:hypothetical protein
MDLKNEEPRSSKGLFIYYIAPSMTHKLLLLREDKLLEIQSTGSPTIIFYYGTSRIFFLTTGYRGSFFASFEIFDVLEMFCRA